MARDLLIEEGAYFGNYMVAGVASIGGGKGQPSFLAICGKVELDLLWPCVGGVGVAL